MTTTSKERMSKAERERRVSYALMDASMFIERMRGRLPKRETAALLNTLADAGELVGVTLTRVEEE